MNIDPAQQRLYTGDQLSGTERLTDMVICSHRQRIDLVLLLYLGRQENNSQPLIGLPDASAYLKTVDAWYHHIQQGDINIMYSSKLMQRLMAIRRLQHLKAIALQINNNKTADRLFVLQYQYFTH